LGAPVGPVWPPPTRALIHAWCAAVERPSAVRVGDSHRGWARLRSKGRYLRDLPRIQSPGCTVTCP